MKKTIALFIMIMLIIPVCMSPKKRDLEIFINTGGSFMFTPKSNMEYYNPSFLIGIGLGVDLSLRLSLRGSFNYYSFYPAEDYIKYLGIGDLIIDISDWHWYVGDHFNSFYNFMIDTKYSLIRCRLSLYITGGIGFTINRIVTGEFVSIEGNYKIIRNRYHFICGGGFGIRYQINKRYGIFLEPSWIFKYRENYDLSNNSIIMLRTGLTFDLGKSKN